MLIEGRSKIDFDSCQYRELANPEHHMGDWDVVMSRPTSIDKPQKRPKKSYLDRNEFKVINHRRNKHGKNPKKGTKKPTRKKHFQIVDQGLSKRSR